MQRGKALKIAELEVQRLKDKIAELDKRRAVGPATQRVAPRHTPGAAGPAPLQPTAGASEGGDFDIDQMLDSLKETK
jgi:hypothetical protein